MQATPGVKQARRAVHKRNAGAASPTSPLLPQQHAHLGPAATSVPLRQCLARVMAGSLSIDDVLKASIATLRDARRDSSTV
jgi:hypothetical protein